MTTIDEARQELREELRPIDLAHYRKARRIMRGEAAFEAPPNRRVERLALKHASEALRLEPIAPWWQRWWWKLRGLR